MAGEGSVTAAHVIKPLTPETFPAWLALAQKHNGVWGGCYCTYFHGDTEATVKGEYNGSTFKRRLVDEGVAHAALVFDGGDAIAWCEYGSPAELPGIYHRKQYDAGEAKPAPWRITCFFVDRDHRRSGVARGGAGRSPRPDRSGMMLKAKQPEERSDRCGRLIGSSVLVSSDTARAAAFWSGALRVERLLALGARRVDLTYSDDATHVVLADPDGNLFCVCA